MAYEISCEAFFGGYGSEWQNHEQKIHVDYQLAGEIRCNQYEEQGPDFYVVPDTPGNVLNPRPEIGLNSIEVESGPELSDTETRELEKILDNGWTEPELQQTEQGMRGLGWKRISAWYYFNDAEVKDLDSVSEELNRIVSLARR